jgi:methylase of polypeptide subunit release factors
MYQSIIPALKTVLIPGRWAVFEVGRGQGPAMEKMIVNQFFNMNDREHTVRKGLYAVERVVAGKRQADAA